MLSLSFHFFNPVLAADLFHSLYQAEQAYYRRGNEACQNDSVVCLYTPVSQSVPKMEGIYATGGILFWGCTFCGVYIPCISSHARGSYRRRFRSLLLCPLSVERYYFLLLVDSDVPLNLCDNSEPNPFGIQTLVKIRRCFILCEMCDVKRVLLIVDYFLLPQLFKVLAVCCSTLSKSFYPLQKCPFELDLG